jgi:zinc protease
MDIEQVVLKNKLKTLFVDQKGANSGSVQIWFRAGSALEAKSTDHGIAHFLEHMFFKGTKKRPDGMIAEEVEAFGGELNAFTSFDYTCYYINPPHHKILESVDILLDMVANPIFLESDLKPEREVVFEEYRRSIDNPKHYAFHEIQQNSFKGGYAHPILGSQKSIKNFKRAQLQSFRKNYYNLQNAMLVVAGDLKQKKLIKQKIESFKLPSGKESFFPQFKVNDKDAIHLHKKDVKQCLLYLTIEAVPLEAPTSAAEDLIFATLGHGESCRLYQNLVIENSLASSANSSSMFMVNGGAHFLKVSYEVENSEKVLNRLYEVLVKLREGLSEAELNRIKFQYASSKIFERESLDSFAFSLGHGFAQNGDIHSEEKFIEKIKDTKLSQVNEAISAVFARPLSINLQIPLDAEEKELQKHLNSFLQKWRQFQGKEKKIDTKKQVHQTSKYDSALKLVELKDGVTLLHKHNPTAPTFASQVYLHGGLSFETEQNNGIYHLISSTITKGHRDLEYLKLKEYLEGISASLMGFSGKNAYGLTMHALSTHSKEVFEQAYLSLSAPRFTEEFFQHELTQAKRAIEMRLKDPVKQCFEMAGEVFFGKHPYALSVLGSEKSLKLISRQNTAETHAHNVKTSKVLISYAGSDDLETVLRDLDPMIQGLSKRSPVAKNKTSINYQQKDHVHIDFDREQTHIFYGVPTPEMSHPDHISLRMISTFLSGQSSELFTKVRDEMGLCYTAQPVNFSALEGGYFGIYMGSGHDKAVAAISAIKDILHRLRDKGIKKGEFQKIKTMIQGQNLVQIQTHEDYLNAHAVTCFQGLGLDYFFHTQEKIKNLSYEEFLKVINKVFSQKWSLITAGRKFV